MPHRSSRSRFVVPAAAAAALLALPSAASATVTQTHVTSPADDTISTSTFSDLSGIFGLPDTDDTITVTGLAPGADDGDEITLVCTTSTAGQPQIVTLNWDEGGYVEDGKFTATGVVRPPLPCRLRAVPYGWEDDPTDIDSFTGPRLLGGGFGDLTDDEGPLPFSAWLAFRSQRRGLGYHLGIAPTAEIVGDGGLSGPFGGLLGSGGLLESTTVEDTDLRIAFFLSGTLSPFAAPLDLPLAGRVAPDPFALENAPIVVDGRYAMPLAQVGDRRSRVVSQTTDPANGDIRVVTRTPIGLISLTDDESVSAEDSGLDLERTIVQDHDGRQITYSDVVASVDGRAHQVELRYGAGTLPTGFDNDLDVAEPASFRVPWAASGDAYVVPTDETAFGPAPSGAATIWMHAPRLQPAPDEELLRRRASTRQTALPPRAEGAVTYDAPPSDGRFVSGDYFVARFIRDVPAGGSTSVRHTYSQDITEAGLAELVRDARGENTPTPPAVLGNQDTAPLPTQPVLPPRRLFDPLPGLSSAARGLLLKPKQARRLRDGRSVSVVKTTMPPGRYGVTIRRNAKGGKTLASGLRTSSRWSTAKVRLKLTKYGKRYFAAKRRAGTRRLSVRVITTYTPVGGLRSSTTSTRIIRFR